MKKLISILTVVFFMFSANVFAEGVTKENGARCGVCGTEVTVASNIFKIDDVEYACPGCGLAALSFMKPGGYTTAMAQDFLRRMMIDATKAWYLRGTEIGFCCEPNWLAFSTKEEAEKFAKGFGGEVLDFESAIKVAPDDHGFGHSH